MLFGNLFKKRPYISDSDETFSSIECITECLSDAERTDAIMRAIQETVRPGDIVLDAGTGSAILAMTAARAGAKKVIALEIDPYVAERARENIQRNGLGDVVELVETDAREFRLPNKGTFDVVIMELLTTGMVDEHQVATMNNLHTSGVVDEKTRFVPVRQDTYVALLHKNFEYAGFDVRMIRHLWKWLPNEGMEFLSEKKLLNTISFGVINPMHFKGRLSLEATSDGVFNSIHLSSMTTFSEHAVVGDTLALNAPVAFPLEEDVLVKKGDIVEIEIAYVFGGGYPNFTVRKI